ncbi:hypothetical protein HLH26_15755 [Gluconacetobacter sp. 1b LMG 1731]|uniref:Uncharacterized protein n=1 Tax=Gluconacetobacter dulcium TaxID=2729096 RepID=A0A7W4NWX6_9PROT|nr:hypothetical protein [Gluconacetobacter dulcium]MBB2165960.1 hypothetical protein [Gluconacetobacter dulcium]MBB2195037.1 hypothetical protein [Gluconacetobacter dulcium]MBB2197699.1 hypothetical protein [Gluconacetobacter dulcium]
MRLRLLFSSLAVMALIGASDPLSAATPCRDAKGKFIACPKPKPVKCRDEKGRYTKCPGQAANPG